MSATTSATPSQNNHAPRPTRRILRGAPPRVKASAAAATLAMLAAVGGAQDATPAAGGAASITVEECAAHQRWLASPELKGRGAGTPEGYRVATWIAGEFARLGLYPAGPDREYFQPFDLPTGKRGRNVLGLLPGSGGERAREVVIVSAHYDHLPPRERPDGTTVWFPGADDNASGAAALLELAEAFAEAPARPARSLLFVAWDGEENQLDGIPSGLCGSRHWVAEPTIALERIAAMTTMDMLSRDFLSVMDDTLYVVGAERSDAIRAVVEAAAPAAELVLDHAAAHVIGPRSDHWPFFGKQVPILFFSTSQHRDYHQPTDTAARARPDKCAKATRAIHAIVRGIADAPERPTFRAEPFQGPEELRTLVRVGERVLAKRDRFEIDAAALARLEKVVADTKAALEKGEITPQQRSTLQMAAGLLLFQIREKRD